MLVLSRGSSYWSETKSQFASMVLPSIFERFYSNNHSYTLGAVYSWGDGDYGKLGRGGSDGCKAPKVIERLMGQDVIKVYCGAQFSLALTKSGAVFSW